MNTKKIPVYKIAFISLLGLIFSPLTIAQIQQKGSEVSFNFEEIQVGKIPDGWNIEATNRQGALATWQVIKDNTAPSGLQVLALTGTNHSFGGTFNLCWTHDISFLNGEISVMFKALKGLEDQGGGVIWRARDKDNYYISRYNPLENNFRIYYVKEGARRMLASARIELPAGKWYELRIIQNGTKITGFLNGKKLLDVEDNTFNKAGGAGLWVKADGITSFDNFKIK